MANQYTDELLELDSHLTPLTSAAVILNFDAPNFYNNFMCMLVMTGNTNYTGLIATKETLICLLAAMSDEDLIELGFVKE